MNTAMNMKDIMDNILVENNLAIIGSRSFNNFTYAKKEILNIIQTHKISITKIISGGASGADKVAEMFAAKFNIPIEIIKPDWVGGGKIAGVVRNTDIIKKSNYVIAFWDGKSKGTLDSINKAKRMGKKLFIIKISPESVNEGVRLNPDDTYSFDFNRDQKDDLLKLTYNKDFTTSKKTNGVVSYYSYKINKDKGIKPVVRNKLMNYIKSDLEKSGTYEHLLNKAVLGLFNNPNLELGDVDMIVIPPSSSTLNMDLANKIHAKIPNAMFSKGLLLKNDVENVMVNYDLIREKNFKQDTILAIEKMVQKSTVDGQFKIKKITPMFRKFVFNFLKMGTMDRRIMNTILDGKCLIIDDFVVDGSTMREVSRLLENYAPKEVILYSLIG